MANCGSLQISLLPQTDISKLVHTKISKSVIKYPHATAKVHSIIMVDNLEQYIVYPTNYHNIYELGLSKGSYH